MQEEIERKRGHAHAVISGRENGVCALRGGGGVVAWWQRRGNSFVRASGTRVAGLAFVDPFAARRHRAGRLARRTPRRTWFDEWW